MYCSTKILVCLWAALFVIAAALPSTGFPGSEILNRAVSSNIKPRYATPVLCPSTKTSATVFEPSLYNISPSHPLLAKPPVNCIELNSQTYHGPLEQVMVFRHIPASAKACYLNWAQAPVANRTFHVKGSGLVALKQLTSFPSNIQNISAHSIAPYEPVQHFSRVDFTSWDQLEAASTHIGGPVQCGTEIYVKANIDTLNGGGSVSFKQDARNGFYLEFSC